MMHTAAAAPSRGAAPEKAGGGSRPRAPPPPEHAARPLGPGAPPPPALGGLGLGLRFGGAQHAAAHAAHRPTYAHPPRPRPCPCRRPARRRRPPSRRLGASTELTQQCEWAPLTERCGLGGDFTSRTLATGGAAGPAAAEADPVARLVSKSLACARVRAAAACDADPGCAWDAAFTDGAEGCFLSDAAHTAAARLCAAPQHARAVAALQACMAQRRSCQCANAAGCARAAAVGSAGCRPLLGCWLAQLQGQAFDVVQLAEAQLLSVGPLLSRLAPNATAAAPGGQQQRGGAAAAVAAGSRRRLLQPAGLNSPVVDDVKAGRARAGGGGAAAAASGAKPPKPAAPAPAADQGSGQNKPILSEHAAATSGGPGAGAGGKLEFASLYDAGIIQAETTVSSAAAAAAAAGAIGANGPSDGDGALAYAPPAFWKCLAEAAARVDGRNDWGSIDFNSKKLTVETWLGALHKLVRGGWGAAKRADAWAVGRLSTGAVPLPPVAKPAL
jgi:hypothetical protein